MQFWHPKTGPFVTREQNVSWIDKMCRVSQLNVLWNLGRSTAMFQLDFNETHNEEPMSILDQRFLKHIKEAIHRRQDGHLEMPLPFKIDEAQLPNNRNMAMKRLEWLEAEAYQRQSI